MKSGWLRQWFGMLEELVDTTLMVATFGTPVQRLRIALWAIEIGFAIGWAFPILP